MLYFFHLDLAFSLSKPNVFFSYRNLDSEDPPDPQLMRPPAYEPGCGMMDSCCGMSDEGCCVGGQQCYTYYENICENVNVANCNMRGRKVCEQIELQDCRVVRERSSLVS